MNNFRKLLLVSASLLVTPAAFAQNGNCEILSYQNLSAAAAECKILKIENGLSGFSGKDRGIYRPNDLAIKRSETTTTIRPEVASAPETAPIPGTTTDPVTTGPVASTSPAATTAPGTPSTPGTATGPVTTGPVVVTSPATPATAPALTPLYEIVTVPGVPINSTYTIEIATSPVDQGTPRIITYEIFPLTAPVSEDRVIAYLQAEDAKTVYFSSYDIQSPDSKDHPAAERSRVEISVDNQPAGNNQGNNNPGGQNNPNDNPDNDPVLQN